VIAIEFLLLPRVLAALHYDEAGLTATSLIYEEIAEGLCVFIATGILALCERRRMDAYGLPVSLAFGRLFWEGAAIGVVAAGGVALAMIAAGGMAVHGLALHGGVLLITALLWLIGMVLVGVNEEYMFRGYPLQALRRGMGFWPAAIVLSLLFGAAHLTKPGENAIDITNIILLGALLCLSLQRTGSLWLAVGFHFSFDFMQFFVIGTRNGGAEPVGHLLDVAFPGPAWVNGGALGTEASYFMLPMIALFMLYLVLRYPRPQTLQT
jgi:membrane protease YdiL (CAAX protease family)